MQLRHAVLPESGVNLPAGQRLHVATPGDAPNDPGKHGNGLEEPTGQAVPASQVMQSSTLAMTVSELLARVPAGHGSAAAAPAVQ